MIERSECIPCPINEKLNLYLEASKNLLLSRQLAEIRGLFYYPDDVMAHHWFRTYQTIHRNGCLTGILCPKEKT